MGLSLEDPAFVRRRRRCSTGKIVTAGFICLVLVLTASAIFCMACSTLLPNFTHACIPPSEHLATAHLADSGNPSSGIEKGANAVDIPSQTAGSSIKELAPAMDFLSVAAKHTSNALDGSPLAAAEDDEVPRSALTSEMPDATTRLSRRDDPEIVRLDREFVDLWKRVGGDIINMEELFRAPVKYDQYFLKPWRWFNDRHFKAAAAFLNGNVKEARQMTKKLDGLRERIAGKYKTPLSRKHRIEKLERGRIQVERLWMEMSKEEKRDVMRAKAKWALKFTDTWSRISDDILKTEEEFKNAGQEFADVWNHLNDDHLKASAIFLRGDLLRALNMTEVVDQRRKGLEAELRQAGNLETQVQRYKLRPYMVMEMLRKERDDRDNKKQKMIQDRFTELIDRADENRRINEEEAARFAEFRAKFAELSPEEHEAMAQEHEAKAAELEAMMEEARKIKEEETKKREEQAAEFDAEFAELDADEHKAKAKEHEAIAAELEAKAVELMAQAEEEEAKAVELDVKTAELKAMVEEEEEEEEEEVGIAKAAELQA